MRILSRCVPPRRICISSDRFWADLGGLFRTHPETHKRVAALRALSLQGSPQVEAGLA